MRRIGLLVSLSMFAWSSTAFAQAGGGGNASGPPASDKGDSKFSPGASPPAAEQAPDAKPPAPAKPPPVAEEEPIEEVEGAEESEEGPQPDAKSGVITGRLIDAETKEEIIDGQCTVAGTKFRGISDADGNFGIKLPPGTYQVRCFFEGYRTARIDNVVVTAGKKTVLRVALDVDAKKRATVEEIVVEVDPDRTTAATQLFLRKNAATVSDAVSAKDIAKTPDRNAAEATKRVVGASVVDGRFVYVRGLGDRYTNSLLNGTPLPSPEPDLQAIPLDIFPVNVISDVTIYKTFTPDMPADFAGGSVRIQTRAFPSRFFFAYNLSTGYNTYTTFRWREAYEGSRTDFLARDSGARRLPPNIAQSDGKIGGSQAELEWYGAALNQRPRRIGSMLSGPNFSGSITTGDTITLFGNPLGWIAAVGYGRRFALRSETQRTFEAPGGDLVRRVDFEGLRSNEMASLSGLGSVGYQIGQNHRFTATTLYSRSSEDDILSLSGYSRQDDATIRVQRARWIERDLLFVQLLGEHKFVDLNRALLKWNGFIGVAKRGEPNNVQSVYQRPLEREEAVFEAKSGDGLTHFFSDQSETMKGAGLDWSQPMTRNDAGPKLKAGTLLTLRDREFSARRFRFNPLPTPGVTEWGRLPPEDILARENIGRFAVVEENTRTTDIYFARQKVYAGYLMADLPIGPLRLIGGTRLEYTNLSVVARDDLQAGSPLAKYGYQSTDFLPAFAAVYKLKDDMNLRASVAQTIARPQFREVARFDYADFFNAQLAVGNPDLKRSRITNLDFRWEFFPSADEVVAASLFYKHFEDPIEASFVLGTSQVSRRPQNAQSARNLGIELEGRKRLFWGFAVLGNLTLVNSRVTLRPDQVGPATSKERPLAGQSPWVINGALDWTSPKERTRARLSYNVFGRRIDTVGFFDVPDTYEMPRHVVDISVAQRLGSVLDAKVSIENLFNEPYRFLTGVEEAQVFRVGQTFWFSLGGEL